MTLVICKLVSLNVRGINNFRKRRTIYTWCRKQKADFIFLQETHSKVDSERQWKNEWGGDMIMSHGTSNSCGVAILFLKRKRRGLHCSFKNLGSLRTFCTELRSLILLRTASFPTSVAESSLFLPREIPLVAAGHVSARFLQIP